MLKGGGEFEVQAESRPHPSKHRVSNVSNLKLSFERYLMNDTKSYTSVKKWQC